MKYLISIALVVLVMASGCRKENRWDCFKSKGDITTEIRQLPPFHKLEFFDDINLVLVPDSSHWLKLTGGENLLESIETKMEDDRLVVTNENRCNWVRNLDEKVTIELHFDSLTLFDFHGSESVTAADTLRSRTFDFNFYIGGGSANLPVVAFDAFFRIHTGTGDITVNGRAENTFVYSSSNGFFFLEGLDSRFLTAVHEGTGDMHVRAREQLRAEIKSLGNVYYYGNPDSLSIWDVGSGTIEPR